MTRSMISSMSFGTAGAPEMRTPKTRWLRWRSGIERYRIGVDAMARAQGGLTAMETVEGRRTERVGRPRSPDGSWLCPLMLAGGLRAR